MSHQILRRLSTNARVPHHAFPSFQAARPVVRAAKWVSPVLVVATIVGFSVSSYPQDLSYRTTGQSEAWRSAVEANDIDDQNEQLLDAYGARDSLDSLQDAIKAYESQKRT